MVGLATNAAGYLLYLAVTSLGVEPKRGMTALYVLGMAVGFAGNRSWAFSHQGPMLGPLGAYLAAHAVGYGLNLLILAVFVDRLGYAHQWVQAVAIVVVAAFLFVAFRYIVFAPMGPRRP